VPPLITDSPAIRGGPSWLVEMREAARAHFEQVGLPDASDEAWRYSPIGDLDLERFDLAEGALELSAPPTVLGAAASIVHVTAGRIAPGFEVPAGTVLTTVSDHPEGSMLLGDVASAADALVSLNGAHLDDALVIDIPRGTHLEAPIVVMHHVTSGASFPRTLVRLGDGAEATVIELVVGGAVGTLNVPVTELSVGDGANLRYGSLQLLDHQAWHLASIAARVGRDGTIAQLTAGLGGAYDRCRTDVELAGQGASSILRSTYFGSGDQIHDLRTKQDHAAPRTISDLLCKGAVTDSARSVYTGVIKVRNGAVRSDARQSNHNLVLSEAAHADSVPNLDIAENDVRCSHASTVGPIDEDQRYYLESRGVSPDDTERLLVRGFFKDLLDHTTLRSAAELVQSELDIRLEGIES